MQKQVKQSFSIVLILIGFTLMSFAVGYNVLLRLHLKEGEKSTITVKSTMLTTMKVQGQSINSTQSIDIVQDMLVKKVSDTANIIESEVKSMKMSQSQMGMSLTYDSEHPEKTSPMLATAVKAIEKDLNKPFTTTLDECGKVIEVSEEIAINNLPNVVIALPKDEIHVGSTWSNAITKEASGKEFSATMTYTVKEITKKNVVLDIAGAIDSSAEVSGTYEGTANISVKTGLVTTESLKQNLSMTVSEQGLSIPITISGTTNITLE